MNRLMVGKEILVVDDDKVTLRTLEKILIKEGYSVIPLSLGSMAAKIAKDRSPDLIILDIMMPDMDGGEVASVLKNDPETMNIPILFLSSLVSKDMEKSSRREQVHCFLAKPFEREKLLQEIIKTLA